MSVSSRLPSRLRSPVRRGAHARVRVSPWLSTGLAATTSVQRGGGPQDAALYRCACGCDFHAAVSTSVGCPACGGAQTW